MTDIREGRAATAVREGRTDPSILRPLEPGGSELQILDDGTAVFDLGDEPDDEGDDHFENLATVIDESRLNEIAVELLDEIEVDKEARRKRDEQYSEGLRRTGLGDDAPGGAPFNGSSRATHPMLIEAITDYSARVCSELLPPEGPAKSAIIGTPTNEKMDRAERAARWINYQLTELMPSSYSEIEQGFSQEGLDGAFYLKLIVKDGQPDIEVAHIDMVHRPWNNGDFYKQPRITHEMPTDKWSFEENVASGLWRDVVDTVTSSATIDQTNADQSNDRIIGREQPTENIDDVRTVYETSKLLRLEGPDDELLPYIVTVDEQSRKILAIYRNWEEEDPNKQRLDFLIEFAFMPWRGGYPIGFTHMIGSLSGATSGALRALLDSALLATMPTGVKLKGGTTAGGQNIRPQPGSTVEIQGSLASDPDIRKTYMPLVFPQPSTTLFQLMGFLVDAGRGVVRTSFDEFNKMNGEMPVGTANMMIEQGLKTFGSVFGRQHRAMRRFLKMLWYVNRKTVTDESVVDRFGELLVTRKDFEGPMTVVPVSDPRIFTDTQRMASAQMVASRSDAFVQKGLPSPYKVREVEINLMRAAKVPQPEQFLQDVQEPQRLNAAAENVAASNGMPIKAFAGQDHESHIAQHGAYMDSPLFGSNPVLALKCLPILLNHIGEHIALWYSDAMLLSTNAVLQQTFEDPRITVEALATVTDLEAQLDRLMAELTPEVMQHAQQEIGPAMEILKKAQELMKQLQPPQPMDPSAVAMADVKRQEAADKAAAEQKKAENDRKAQETQQRLALDSQDDAARLALDERKADDAREASERKDLIAAAGIEATKSGQDVQLETSLDGNNTQLTIAREGHETQLELQDRKGEIDLEKADRAAEAAEKAAKNKPASSPAKK